MKVDEPNTTGVGDAEDDDKMVSLAQFIQKVIIACKPDAPRGLVEQMLAATRGMATQSNLRPELQEFGRTLNLILAGERHPDLSTLHPQLANEVSKILEELG
jgi:hypothetical protein